MTVHANGTGRAVHVAPKDLHDLRHLFFPKPSPAWSGGQLANAGYRTPSGRSARCESPGYLAGAPLTSAVS